MKLSAELCLDRRDDRTTRWVLGNVHLVQWMCSPSSSLANRREAQRNISDPVRACSFPTKPFCQRTWDSSTETVLVKIPPENISIILSILLFRCDYSITVLHSLGSHD